MTPEEMQKFFDEQKNAPPPNFVPPSAADETAAINAELSAGGAPPPINPTVALARGEGPTLAGGMSDALMGRKPTHTNEYGTVIPGSAIQAQQGTTSPIGPPTSVGGSSQSPVSQPTGPAIQPGRYVAAGWDKSRLPWKPETMKAAESAIGQHEQAVGQITSALSAQQDAIDRFHQEQAVKAQDRAAQQYQVEQARQDQYKQQSQKYQEFVDKAGADSVDPQRYMHNMGTGNRIILGIGAALGGFVNAKTGAANPVLDMVQKNIDRDIQSQQQDLATKRWKAGSQLNMLGELRAQGMDERMAANTLESAQWRIAEEQLKSQLAQTDSPVIQARGADALAAMNDKRVGLKMEADQIMHHNAQFIGAQGIPKGDLSKVFTGSDGQRYMARNEESRKTLAASATTYANIESSLNDYQKALQNVSASDRAAAKVGITTPAMAQAYTAYNHALSPMRQAQHDGVWKKGEVEMLAETLAPPEQRSGDPMGQAKLAKEQAKVMNDHTMKVEDALPVDTGFAATPTGRLAPDAAYTGQEQKPLQVGMPGSFRPVGK